MESPSTSLKFTLADELGSVLDIGEYDSTSEVLPAHQPQNVYIVRRDSSTDGPARLSVVSESDRSRTDASTEFARLTVALPVVTIAALVADVSVVPDATSILKQPLNIEPTSEKCTTLVMLRPGDVIQIGLLHRLKLDVKASEHPQVQVQVGSSIPSQHAQPVNDELADDNSKSHITATERNSGEIEVNRSIRMEEMEMRSQTPSATKAPVILETPASRQRFVDALSYTENSESGHSPQRAQSPSPELLEPDIDDRESKQDTTLAVDNPDPIEGEPPKPGDIADDAFPAEQELDFATAPSEYHTDTAESPLASKTATSRGRGRKRKSEESAETTPQTKRAKRETASKAKSAEKTEIPEQTKRAKRETTSKAKSTEKAETPEQTKRAKRETTSKARLEARAETPEQTRRTTREAVSKMKSPIAIPLAKTPAKKSSTPLKTLETKAKDQGNHTSTSPSENAILKSPRIVFSNSTIPERSSTVKFLSSKGAKQVEKMSPRGFDMLVVGDGELKKTFKLLTAVALGKLVVTDSWALQSSKDGDLLDPMPFVPRDQMLEDQWDVNLAETIAADRRGLFKGRTILVTTALRREYGADAFKDIQELGTILGAKRVVSIPFRSAGSEKNESGLLIMAREANDLEMELWRDNGHTCYTKDLMSISILRGRLDEDDERLKITKTTTTSKKRKTRGSKKAS